MWLREFSSCSRLTALPAPAWVLLDKTYKPSSTLYICLQCEFTTWLLRVSSLKFMQPINETYMLRCAQSDKDCPTKHTKPIKMSTKWNCHFTSFDVDICIERGGISKNSSVDQAPQREKGVVKWSRLNLTAGRWQRVKLDFCLELKNQNLIYRDEI